MLISLEKVKDPDQVGAKAAALGRMLRAGVKVPPGFVLPARHFEDFVSSSRRREEIKALCEGLSVESPRSMTEAASRIEAWLLETPLSKALTAALRTCFRQLGVERLVVRSSAIGEDSARASFAGQLDSFLDIADEGALLDAVRRCWCSLYTARVLAYQRATGVGLRGMAVIVQAQIRGAVSGVAFTCAPHDPGSLLFEMCEGSCEALVSGKVVPTSVTVDRRRQRFEGELVLLTADQLQNLIQTALRLEEDFGAPQDIEWTIDPAGQLHLLQSRPITAVDSSPMGEPAVFSNANINENYPSAVTPLLQSIARTSYYHYFRNIAVAYGFSSRRIEAMEEPLRNIVGVHGQRLYYDVSNIHAVLRMAPWGSGFAEWFNAFVGVEETTTARARDVTWRRGTVGRAAEVLELLTIAVNVTRQYSRLAKQVESFETRVSAFAARSTPVKLRGLSKDALVERVAGFIDIRFDRWLGAALADGACMVCCGALEWFLGRHFSESPQVLLHGLLRGLPGIVSSEPPRQLWHLSRQIRGDASLCTLFEKDTPHILQTLGWDGETLRGQDDFARALQSFLDDWGFRCTGELMLTVSSFQEQPDAVVDMLRSYMGMSSDGPDEVIAQQAELRHSQTARLSAELGWVRGVVFRRLLLATGSALAFRERARLKQALLYRCLRRIVLALGGHLVKAGDLEAADDLFFMTWQELLALGEGAGVPASCIAERRDLFAEQSAWPAPPSRIVLRRDQTWSPTETVVTPDEISADGLLTGLAAAAGKVTGRATVARGQVDFHRVAAGDVLVAPQTDPGWATVLFLVRGLVMERGGMLSHGAIIAREFGIPSVVAVERATERIPNGCTVTVDGDQGHVRIVE